MLVIPYFLVKFYIILRLTANCVGSEEIVYVSRFSGNDSTTCGERSLPCRTISYAIQQALEGSYIYLDGTSTSKDPYSCQPVDPKHSGIYLTKNISFVGMASRAYISCLHGNKWIVDGNERKHGLQVSFHGFTFVNTTLVFLEAFVNISDSLFEDSKNVTMIFNVFNLARFNLSLSNVVFQRNAACMGIVSDPGTEIFINMKNTSFIENGFSSDLVASYIPSILIVESNRSDIDIQLRYCSFKSNTFREPGMIVVDNKGGAINLLLYQFKFEENEAYINISQINGIFALVSAKVIMRLKSGFIHSTSGTFVIVDSYESDINISNIEVDKFHTSNEFGGVFDIYGTSSFLSLEDSCFRNGGSILNGGVLDITATNLLLTIRDCTFHKISALGHGGAICIQPQEWRNVNSFFQLHITNSTFSNCASRVGGAIAAEFPNLVATITDSLFVQNMASASAGAGVFIIDNSATMHLRNVNFIGNNATLTAIFGIKMVSKESNFIFTTDNVMFIGNNLHTLWLNASGILYLIVNSKISNIVFKSTHLISNIGYGGSSIAVMLDSSTTSNSITLDTCTFRANCGLGASFRVQGQATLICKHSTFDSYNLPRWRCMDSWALLADTKNSRIAITNSTFVNNVCGAVLISMDKNSYVKIEHSVFVHNYVPNAVGSAIHIQVVPINENDLNKAHMQSSRNLHQYNVLIENGLFKENVSPVGGALALENANSRLLNCTFINNFARSQGGQISTTFFTSLTVSRCVFKQTIQKVIINGDEYIASSFLGIYGTGKLLLQNTKLDSKIISNTPLIVVTRADEVNVDNSTTITCPLGSALKKSSYKYQESKKKKVTAMDLSCNKCGYNHYSLQRGHAKGLNVDNSFKCIPCPRGADCLSTIVSKPNFWGYNASLNPRTLAFTLCPFGYCKSPKPNSSKFNECHGKRTGVMCGSCSDGYTEALWSTYCTPIKDCNEYWFWVLFLVLVVLMAILLVFNPPFITYSVKHVQWLKRFITNEANPRELGRETFDEEERGANRSLSSSEQLKQDKRQRSRFLEIVFYFYQIAQLLLSSYSLREFFHSEILPPVLGFFNFEPRLHRRGFLCPFPGLTPNTKLAFKILPVFGTMVAIFTIYFFHVFINKLRRSLRPSISPYLQASIKTVFLGYTTLATVGMSLIRCVSVAGEDRWFYNGNIICYQWWQYVSFAFNGIFVIPLIFVLGWASFKVHHGTITVRQFLLAIAFPLPFSIFWLLRVVCPSERANAEESENFAAIKEMLLGPYKEAGNGSKYGAMYWQSVLIARRLILVLIFCVVTEPCIRLFCMTLTCVFVLFFHLRVKPFRNSSANNFESLSLLLLIILGLINLLKSVFVGFEGIIKGPLVTVFKVFQWLEIVILGLFPALVSVLVCFSIISLILRVLFMCCRSLFKCIFRRCARRNLSQDTTVLINVGEDIDVD